MYQNDWYYGTIGYNILDRKHGVDRGKKCHGIGVVLFWMIFFTKLSNVNQTKNETAGSSSVLILNHKRKLLRSLT